MERNILDALAGLRQKASHQDPEWVRDLTEEDLVVDARVHRGTKAPALVKLKATHHHMAKLVAEGRPGTEISALTGYTQTRISILQDDPAFQELVAYYTVQNHELYQDVHRKLATLGVAAVDQLIEDLEDTPERFTVKDKLDVASMALERSGLAAPKRGSNIPGGSAGGVAINISFKRPTEEHTVQVIDQLGGQNNPGDSTIFLPTIPSED